jgi:hypothetical protein
MVHAAFQILLFLGMFFPGICGIPPMTTMVGSPIVWESTAMMEREMFMQSPLANCSHPALDTEPKRRLYFSISSLSFSGSIMILATFVSMAALATLDAT